MSTPFRKYAYRQGQRLASDYTSLKRSHSTTPSANSQKINNNFHQKVPIIPETTMTMTGSDISPEDELTPKCLQLLNLSPTIKSELVRIDEQEYKEMVNQYSVSRSLMKQASTNQNNSRSSYQRTSSRESNVSFKGIVDDDFDMIMDDADEEDIFTKYDNSCFSANGVTHIFETVPPETPIEGSFMAHKLSQQPAISYTYNFDDEKAIFSSDAHILSADALTTPNNSSNTAIDVQSSLRKVQPSTKRFKPPEHLAGESFFDKEQKKLTKKELIESLKLNTSRNVEEPPFAFNMPQQKFSSIFDESENAQNNYDDKFI